MENEVNKGLENQNPENNNTTVDMPKTNDVTPVNNQAPKAKASIAKFIPIIVAVVVVAVLLAGGLTVKTISSSPRQVFKNTIDNVYKQLSNSLDEIDEINDIFNIEENAIYMSGDMQFETNIDELNEELGEGAIESISKMKFGYEAGIDLKNEQLLGGISVAGSDSNVNAKVYYSDDYFYITSSVLDEVIQVAASEMEDTKIDFSKYKEQLSEITDSLDYNTEDYDYVLETIKNALIKSLDSKKMEKSSGSFEVDDKTVKATKISYVFDEDTLKEYIRSVCEILTEDDEFLSKMADITTLEKADIKDAIKELKDSVKEIELEEDFAVNIYIKGLTNKTVGFSVEVDDKEYFSIYSDGEKTTELIVDNHTKDEYSQVKLVITAVKENDETTINVKYNKEQIATFTIREISDELVDFDAKVTYEDNTYKMSVYYTRNVEKSKISGEYKYEIDMNDEYAKYSGSYNIEPKSSLIDIDLDDAVDFEDVDTEKLYENLKEVVESDDAFNDLLGDYLQDMEKEMLGLNSYGMKEVTDYNEAIELLKNTKSTVLFVGKTYYYSSESDAEAMFENLKKAQDELGFYSYYMSEYRVTDEFKTAANTEYVCSSSPAQTDTPTENQTETPTEETQTTETTPACNEYPTIYLIKDGQIVKAYRGTISYDDLKTALAAIDIK